MISVRDLRKSYGSVEALRGISFEVGRGEIVGLLGPNGAGKTTTMKILTGFLQPSEGTAEIDGIDVVESPLQVQAKIGYLPENAPLYLDMLVQDYLMMMADLREIPLDRRRALVSEAVHSTSIEDMLTRPIQTLSKGYRQRVCLAQAILHRPPLLILDEPTNGLDPTQIIEIRGLIRRLAKEATVIVSTHILSEVAVPCHRAIIIMNGEIRADARLAELTSTANAVAAIDADMAVVAPTLEALPGVMRVESVSLVPTRTGFSRFRITGERSLDLCPLVYDTAKEKGWRLAELRPETRTLENVFRELAQREGVAA